MSEHQRQRAVGIGDGSFREVLTLPLETFAVPDELLAVEVGRKTDRGAQNPIRADDACHATPRVDHLKGKTSVRRRPTAVKRNRMPGSANGACDNQPPDASEQ